MMRGNKRTIAILVAGLALGLPLNAKAQQPDPEKARTERKIVSYGQPDDWANWKEIWQVFCAKYSCTHEETDKTSAGEIAKVKAGRKKPAADTAGKGQNLG